MTPIPAWLKQHLIDTGAWSIDGCSRKAKLRRHSCGDVILYGLAGSRCSWSAVVDVTPLSALGEALAKIGGRMTFELWGMELEPRDAIKIKHQPAGICPRDILAANICGSPPLPSLPSKQKITPPKENHNVCPY